MNCKTFTPKEEAFIASAAVAASTPDNLHFILYRTVVEDTRRDPEGAIFIGFTFGRSCRDVPRRLINI